MKILFVSTISNTVNAFLIPHIKYFVEKGFTVDCAFKINREPTPELKTICRNIYDVEFNRNPLKPQNITAYKKLKYIIEQNNYDVINTHTPLASAIVRYITKSNNNTKVIYTAHGFHFYKGAPIKNWLFYYPLERILSKNTDVLITINKEDYSTAVRKLSAKNIYYIPGIGLDIERFKTIENKNIRKELSIPDDAYIILSVGELNNNKNHKIVIDAISKLKFKNIYYLICGVGPNKVNLEKSIDKYQLNKNVKLLGFRKDINKIMKESDLFIFPSYREGLPVSLMEAMASGLPIICSKIRGNVDLIKHQDNGLLFDPENTNELRESIESIYRDVNLQNHFKKENKSKIENFSINEVKKKLESIYIKELIITKKGRKL